MKCQKCGKNEVNFHYSSNINGCVTESHLCSECAATEGYDMDSLFDTGGLFGVSDMFSDFFPIFGRSAFMPAAMQLMSPAVFYPRTARLVARPRTQNYGGSCGCGCGTEGSKPDTDDIKADEAMIKRRELNMELQAAIKSEDFEKAAQLRDQIKGMNT